MRRREFIAFVGGAAVAASPLASRAQQPSLPVIGFLGVGASRASESRMEALREGLREFAYVDGKNVVIESRYVEKAEGLRQSAIELVEQQPAVIVTSGNAATLAVKSATSTIPIIFSAADDPIRLGFVASFNRPGGHMTCQPGLWRS